MTEPLLTDTGTCESCGHEAQQNEGGGFFFHLLHCDRCGGEKRIEFEELGEVHVRYIKGLPGPYAFISKERDEEIQKNYPGEPLTEDEYNAEIARIVGKCECGGQFSMTAPARCPKCASPDIKNTGKTIIYYD